MMLAPRSLPRSRGSFAVLSISTAAAVWMLAVAATQAQACPFCGAVQSTLTQDIQSADVAVVARLIGLPQRVEAKDGELNVATPMAKFEVREVLKGADALAGSKLVEAPFFDDKPLGGEYLLLGAQPPAIVWSPPYALSPRSRKYVSEIVKLPATGPERLAYFQNYCEDKEDLLRNDSYYEFALAPYPMLQAMKNRMQHDKLVAWVRDPAVVVSHRRLYLTMLGVCGGAGDVPMLETLLRSDDPKFKTGLDATVACYLTLKHADGLPLIEQLFLNKKQEEFTDIFSVVMALRFLGQEEHGPIPREQLIKSMRLVLDHPRLADQAIMDLARWQDWTVMDRLVKLFTSADPETTTWVRIPVINYLRACPLPKAKQYIEELRKIDPRAVQQSETLYAVGPDPTPNVATQRGGAATAATGAAAAAASLAGPANAPAAKAASVSPAPFVPPATKRTEAKPVGTTPAATSAATPAAATPSAASSSAAVPAASPNTPSNPPGPSSSSSGAMLLQLAAGLIVALAAVVGAVVLAAVSRGGRGKRTIAQAKE